MSLDSNSVSWHPHPHPLLLKAHSRNCPAELCISLCYVASVSPGNRHIPRLGVKNEMDDRSAVCLQIYDHLSAECHHHGALRSAQWGDISKETGQDSSIRAVTPSVTGQFTRQPLASFLKIEKRQEGGCTVVLICKWIHNNMNNIMCLIIFQAEIGDIRKKCEVWKRTDRI